MKRILMLIALIGAVLMQAGMAANPDPALQNKLDTRTKEITTWAATPELVDAVKRQNQSKSEELRAMTQDKWVTTSALETFIRNLTRNGAAEVLKAKRTEAVTEAFVSDADGDKVAFLAKPTNWNHKGKPKHDQPMSGKNWQGNVEKDESTGFEQIQIAVPVLDGGKPIGSLVVGFNVAKL
ncbi:MAG: hypothetical protein QM808_16385 [Steroidobacteraceae bacterium]